MKDIMRDELGAPEIVDRSTFQAALDALRVREKAHTREGDAIAAARRRLPMVKVDGAIPLMSERGEVTLDEAAAALTVSQATVRRLIKDGVLPAQQLCKGAPWIIRASDLETDKVKRAAKARRLRHPESENPLQNKLEL